MALDREDMERRRKKREAARRMQQRRRRRMLLLTACALVVLVGCGVAIFKLASGDKTTPVSSISETAATTAATTEAATEPGRRTKDPITTIHIRAVGDLNVTNSVVDSGIGPTGYDFSRAFMDVAAELAVGDVTVMNVEGNFCGEPYGSETASAPTELLTYLKSVGVDLVQMANSYSVYNGLIGLNSTLNNIRAAGMEPLGAYATSSDFNKTGGYTICDVQGIKVAFVAFTKGLGGMGLPAGSEDCVNLLYTDYDSNYKQVDKKGITGILSKVAAEKPDITVAMLHWGSVNSDEISKTQTQIVDLMQKNGVDVIIGSHPHLLQKIELNEKTGKLVAYSLGDFYGDAQLGGSNYSVILDIEITKDADLKTTKVTNFSYIPIYTEKETECDGYRRVVRIEQAMHAYENNYVDKVTADSYTAMQKAMKRIPERITGTKADSTTTSTTAATTEAATEATTEETTEETTAETTAAVTDTTA